jgi:hypothetical protein
MVIAVGIFCFYTVQKSFQHIACCSINLTIMIRLRSIFLTLFFISFSFLASAQSKASKLILSGNYVKAQPIIVEGLKKNENDIALNFDAARFFFFNDHKAHKLETAWLHITRCETLLKKINEPKQLNKYAAVGIRPFTIKLLKQQIENAAFQKADSVNTAAAWEFFIAKFNGAEKQAIATERRNDAAFKEAQQNFSYESFKEFMEKYPNAAQAHEAKNLYESLLYKKITQPGTWQVYKEFLDKNPNSPYIDEAQEKYEWLLYADVCKVGNINSYIDFVKKYSANRYVPQAEDSIYNLFISTGNAENYLQFVQQFPKNKNANDAWINAYLLATSRFTVAIIDSFASQHAVFPFKTMVQNDKKLAQLGLVSFEENERFGFKDIATQEVKIKPLFEEAAEFSGRLAAAKPLGCEHECKFGYINKEGSFIIEVQFDEAGDFVNGFAVVGKGNCAEGDCKYGLINQNGKKILPIEFDEVFDMTKEGLALVKQNGIGYGYTNAAGKIVLPLTYTDANSFSEGLASVKIDSLWRFINTNGNAVIAPLFYAAGNFVSGLAPVANAQNLWGYINTDGQYIVQPKYAFANAFEGDRAIVLIKEKNKKGLEITIEKTIDLKGNIVEQEKPKTAPPKKKPKK